MQYNSNFQSLYNVYIEQRNLHINEDEFMQLVMTLPALLVALADDKVDPVEKKFLQGVAKKIAAKFAHSSNKSDNIATVFFNEFTYILDNLSLWQIPFIEVLADYLEENSEQKIAIEEMINNIAEVSEGICDDERVYIQQLVNSLRLRE